MANSLKNCYDYEICQYALGIIALKDGMLAILPLTVVEYLSDCRTVTI